MYRVLFTAAFLLTAGFLGWYGLDGGSIGGQRAYAASPAAAAAGNGIEQTDKRYVILGWNDLGMHCISPRFAEMAILPPYNTVHAVVIRRGEEPRMVTSGINVNYALDNNQTVAGKTDFWTYAPKLFGKTLAPGIGLTGLGLKGKMTPKGDYFLAEGIPVLPYNDPVGGVVGGTTGGGTIAGGTVPWAAGRVPAAGASPAAGGTPAVQLAGLWNPYQTATLTVTAGAHKIGTTRIVVPVSDEMHCDKCHSTGGTGATNIKTPTVEGNILTLHDRKEHTNLIANRPVLCASCHSDNALGAKGKAGVSSMSMAMHSKHASIATQPNCYDCHPGAKTQCSRSAIAQMGPNEVGADINCTLCHGDLKQVAAGLKSGRQPWLQEPNCVQCHKDTRRFGTGPTLFRNAKGHGGIYCAACHNSPHAWFPSTKGDDNLQPMALQNSAKAIGYKACYVCHTDGRKGDIPPHGDDDGGD